MRLTRQEARDYVITHPEQYLRPAKKRGTYICPQCNNGTGSTGDGITTKDGKHFTCWKCHEIENSDIVDIIGTVEGISDPLAKFNRAYEVYDIEIVADSEAAVMPKVETVPAPYKEEKPTRKEYDFTEEVWQAHKDLLNNKEAMEHFKQRGIDEQTILKFMIGYSEKGYNALLKKYPELQIKSNKESLYKYVFPILNAEGKCTYFIAEITDRKQVDEYNPKYRNLRGVSMQYFNQHYLDQDSNDTIFITEGIYDALSVEQTGRKAIGNVGTNHRAILNMCEAADIRNTCFIIGLDNDKAGIDAIERLKKGFDELHIMYIEKPTENGKDYNEALQNDRELFKKFIGQCVGDMAEKKLLRVINGDPAYKEYIEYTKNSALNHLDSFKDSIERSKVAPFFSTGIKSLDNIIDGGIRVGLYCIGAISSLGKTTFCLQVMDNLAKQGVDVLIFSLEMSKNELIAKSISRETMQVDRALYKTTKHAKTTLGILTGSRYDNYSDTEKEIIEKAIDNYKEYASHIYIYEGMGDISAKTIADKVEMHKKSTGRRPVVMVDYLQIVAPYFENDKTPRSYTDKQAIDKTILELKRLSRSVPVIAISSFNRDSYTEPVNLSSFKESGCIEYTSDVLIGLQYMGMDYQKTSKVDKQGNTTYKRENKEDHSLRVRDLIEEQEQRSKEHKALKIEAKVLKNRNGIRDKCTLEFYPFFNYYQDASKDGFSIATGSDEIEIDRIFNPKATKRI